MFRAPWWLAAAIPALGAGWALFAWAAARRRRVGSMLGLESALSRATEDASARRRWASGLRLTALALILLALAGPRWGVELVETRGSARQVVVAVDVSLSMATPDVKPTRLERAKASLGLLLDQLRGDRVGVVAFAGDAQIVCPLTADVDAAKELLGALEVGAVPVPGTSLGAALRTAAAMLGRYPGAKNVVLLTDGEDHRSDPLGAAREAAASGVRVYTIGIGTPEGEPIPMENGGYKKDAKGSTVVSRLGEDELAQIAKITGGEYSRTTPGEDEISGVASRIKGGEAARGLAGSSARWRDRYAWPLGLAFALLLAEAALPLLPRRGAAGAALLLGLLAAAPARAATFEGRLRGANKDYVDGKYEEALEGYGDASGMRPADPRPVFNAGDALYRLDRDSDAAGAFDSVAARRDAATPLRAAALYNLGNARYRAGDYAGAADAYRKSLALAPADPDARRNLVLALRSQKEPPQKKDKKKDDRDKNKQNQSQDKPQGGQSQDKNDKGGAPSKPRPQESLTREDAERVMREVAEREKAERKKADPAAGLGRKPPTPRAPTEEDW